MSEDDIKKNEQEKADLDKLAEMEKQLKDKKPEPEKSSSTVTAPKRDVDKKATTRASRVAPQPQPEQKGAGGLLWTLTVLNFLVVIAVIAGGYWFWQNWVMVKNEQDTAIQQEVTSIRSVNDTQISRNAQLQEQNQQLSDQVKGLQEQLSSIDAISQSNAVRLNDVSGRRPSDWLLAEADYLVRMAGRKLWLERDVRTAVLMLQSADSRLQDARDPSLLPVRQAIANDLQALQQINDISLPSIALALSAMAKQVTDLPLALPKLPEMSENPDKISDSVDDWWSNLQKQWTYFVDGLVKYQPREAPIRPMLDSQQQWLAREQLRMAIMQAQAAVLSENPSLYQQSLQRALELIVSHFDLDIIAVGKFTESLQNLSENNINRVFPTQLEAAQPLKDIVEARMSSVYSNKGQAL